MRTITKVMAQAYQQNSDCCTCSTKMFGKLPKHTIFRNCFHYEVMQVSQSIMVARCVKQCDLQLNLTISNSVNSKSPLFRSQADCPSFDHHLVLKLGYFKTPLFQTIFHVPWDFEIAGFNRDCKWCSQASAI